MSDDPFAVLGTVDLSGDPRDEILMLPFWLRGGVQAITFAIYLEALWCLSRKSRRGFLEVWTMWAQA